MKRKLAASVMVLAGAAAPGAVFATNGMNLEGYGPIATGMGGASMAYDNGTAAVMNNPATLGLMSEGHRLDLALGRLGPNITASMPGMGSADSSATAFYMPAFGWAMKRGQYTTGFGVFAQGGMGTEYSGSSFMSAGSGLTTRSEVSVGRAIIPLVYDVDQNLKVGGSLDYVWAGMDLQMAMAGSQMMDMMPATMNPGATHTFGTLSGSMLTTLGGFMGPNPGQVGAINWGYFNFSNSNDFTGKATASGYAGKLGMVYKVSPQLTVGATYHSKTQLSDMEASGASVDMNVLVNGTGNVTIPVTGKITVKNFQWPETYGIGMAYQATNELLVVADYKRIGWASVMKDFSMTFTADATQAGGPMASAVAGTSLDATMYQNWKDQNVFMLGAAYKASNALTVRGGVNIANNPVPDFYMNPLFPAIIKNHVTAGAGYAIDKDSGVDFALTYAPKVSATNGGNVTVDHSQLNAQLMYSRRF